jgi:GDP-4-dehydro-6-deoxy-D-mannose reductase
LRILITGIRGFVGKHLTQYLEEQLPGVELYGTIFNEANPADSKITHYAVNLCDKAIVQDLIHQVRPDHIYHLAAQASPRKSFSEPWETLKNNIKGQLNIFEACISANIRPKILVVSSAEIYGPSDTPVTEDHPFCPTSPYGVSKVTQDLLGLQYFLSHQLPVVRMRPFNHIGPGQSLGFVATDFAHQIAMIEQDEQDPVVTVGNLSAKRDFTDVRDIVRAYHLAIEHGTAGEAYNVASNSVHSIRDLLDTLLKHSHREITVNVDPSRYLPVDSPIRQGDASRLHQATGWQPTIPFESTLRDILNDCRQRVQ